MSWVRQPTVPTRVVQVTFDAADPKALSIFWAHALGYVNDDPPAGFESWEEALEALGVPPTERNSASAIHHPADAGPRVFFQQVSEAKAGLPTPRATSSAWTDVPTAAVIRDGCQGDHLVRPSTVARSSPL